ncbi:Putative cell wall binding repeat 2 [Desulfitobacterium hafniense]|uniref:Cell wall binding repeat 2 n=1 Tax=Desulfitobacterium hafniense TaxID=49338 RepID=A0A098BAQ5_DESHA|nr:cell wall-binding repeat-containing protein [Desulfitobacterium hafniense]CDX04966.1 Putative cell wall binding repeat 2 [Desulfitobacterium hafniense]
MFLASGQNFADALAGAAVVAQSNGWLILIGGTGTGQVSTTLTKAQVELLKAVKEKVKAAGAFGGPAAVSESVLEGWRNC